MFFFQDIFHFLKCLTIQKIFNYFILKISFHLSRMIKKPLVWAYPMAISIEPTTACNLECPACPSGTREFTRPTGNMKDEIFQSIILSLKNYLLHINFYFQGEPFIHPKIYDWIKVASKNKIYTLISTNAHFLNVPNCEKIIQSGLSKIIISIDGMSQKVYEQYRVNGSVDRVFEGINTLIKVKKQYNSKTPIIVLQWIAFEHNLVELPLFIKYCKEKKLHYQIKTAQVYSMEQLKKLVPRNEKYTRYEINANKLIIKNHLNNYCWRMWASCVFTQDGMIVPCCFDKDAKYKMGNIKIDKFENVWKSEKYNNFRQKIFKSRTDIDICNNCSEGSKIWV